MNRKSILSMAIVATFTTGLLAAGAPLASAAEKSPATTKSTKQVETTQDKDAIKVSEDAAITMRNVHRARIALFDGQPQAAQTLVDAAVTRVKATMKDANKYAVDIKDKTKAKAGDTYVPFGTLFSLDEGFIPTNGKSKHIAKVGPHPRKGEKQNSQDSLELAGVGVDFTTQLVPVKLAEQHIQAASKLVNDGKYYQANLALKAVEDAVVMESVADFGTPSSQHKGKAS